jgi:hypothetical protein
VNCVDKPPLIITPPLPPLNLRGGREGLSVLEVMIAF